RRIPALTMVAGADCRRTVSIFVFGALPDRCGRTGTWDGRTVVKTCTLLMVCALSLATAGTAIADPAPRDAGLDGLPPNRILAIVRATGFDPMGRPQRNGDLYVVRALDRNDIAYRLSIDARTGHTVSMHEIATPGSYEAAPAYARNRGPIYGWILGPK